MQSDRAGHQKRGEPEISLCEWQSANQCVDDVKATSIRSDKRGRLACEQNLPNGGRCPGRSRIRKSVGKGESLNDITGLTPLLSQLHPNADSTQFGVPWKVNDRKNAKRFPYLKHCVTPFILQGRPKFVSNRVDVMPQRHLPSGMVVSVNKLIIQLQNILVWIKW